MLYGNLQNRFDENKNYAGTIEAGTDITMYYWSDRKCYYVTRVIDQKHIFVREYQVCANHHKPGGMGHQDWLYFKTEREMQEYTNQCVKEGLLPDYCHHELSEIFEPSEQEWCFRYNHWYQVMRYNPESWNRCLENAAKDCKNPSDTDAVTKLARFYLRLSDSEFETIMQGKEIVKYIRIDQGISFGVRDYYYDWEF